MKKIAILAVLLLIITSCGNNNTNVQTQDNQVTQDLEPLYSSEDGGGGVGGVQSVSR